MEYFKFEIYEDDLGMGVKDSRLFETEDDNPRKAFQRAVNWVMERYQDDDSPNYVIVSEFGEFRP